MHRPDFLIGLDLGQAQDYSALCVLERSFVNTGRVVQVEVPLATTSAFDSVTFDEPAFRSEPIYARHYAARHLERLPLGTPYPAQVARVKALHDRLKADTGSAPLLVVDQTGTGRPVVDMLRAVGLAPLAITITGGNAVSRDGLEFKVPKRDLVSATQVLLQSERLKIAKALPEAQTLTAELLAFKVSISLKGHDSYGNDVGPWREAPHDDLVLAVALACWYGERHTPVAAEENVGSYSYAG